MGKAGKNCLKLIEAAQQELTHSTHEEIGLQLCHSCMGIVYRLGLRFRHAIPGTTAVPAVLE